MTATAAHRRSARDGRGKGGDRRARREQAGREAATRGARVVVHTGWRYAPRARPKLGMVTCASMPGCERPHGRQGHSRGVGASGGWAADRAKRRANATASGATPPGLHKPFGCRRAASTPYSAGSHGANAAQATPRPPSANARTGGAMRAGEARAREGGDGRPWCRQDHGAKQVIVVAFGERIKAYATAVRCTSAGTSTCHDEDDMAGDAFRVCVLVFYFAAFNWSIRLPWFACM